MARNQIFISYSHHADDREAFERLLDRLKPWQDRARLQVWSDRQIAAGDDWERRIRGAVDATAVAVLLVSEHFMKSDYIRERELPPLLKAGTQNKLVVTCLYLRPCSAGKLPFTVALDEGETRQFFLTDRQGLNDPAHPLESQKKAERDRCLDEAVREIARLYEGYAREDAPRPRPPGQRDELLIRLDLHGDRLYRDFFTRQTRLASGWSPWSAVRESLRHWHAVGSGALATGLPDALYETLFGAGQNDLSDEVLAALFPAADRPTPLWSGLRVRIQLTASSQEAWLADLPWPRTAWRGKRLADADSAWTFELLGEATDDEIAAFPSPLLPANCPVLLIAPTAGDGGETHRLAIEGRLDHACPAYRERLPPVRTRNQVADALRRHGPAVVYYHGAARADGETLHLRLDDGELDIADLPTLWSRAPQILFLNLLDDSAPRLGKALAALHRQVPLLIAQTSPAAAPEPGRQSAEDWFLAFLQGGDDPDPIELFHRHGLPTARIWGRYGKWHYRPQAVSPRDKLARLLLDRENQRRAVQGVVSALVNDGTRRLSCLLVAGDESDLVHLVADQLLEHLRQHNKREAQVLRLRLPLPEEETFTDRQVGARLRSHFSLSHGEPLREGLERQKRPTAERSRLVLLLDWGVRGTPDGSRLSFAALRAWVDFCAKELAGHCPPDMRLLSLLTVQSAREKHAAIAAYVEDLRADPALASPSFTMEHLQALGGVVEGDLMVFLKDEKNTWCPRDHLPEMPRLICRQTGGRFEETVNMMERAESAGARGWLELHAELSARYPDWPSRARGATASDELL